MVVLDRFWDFLESFFRLFDAWRDQKRDLYFALTSRWNAICETLCGTIFAYYSWI